MSDTNKEETVDDTISKAVEVFNKIGMKITETDISVAHRLGKYSEDRPRPIISKFVRRRHKMEAIEKRRKLKGTRIAITEDLTRDNYFFLLKVKDQANVDTAWTRDGVVFAKLKSNGRITKVLSMRDVQ